MEMITSNTFYRSDCPNVVDDVAYFLL